MFERLDQIEARYDELTQTLASPEIMNDSARYQKTAKAHSEISLIVERYREYKDLKRGIAESRAMLADEKDPDMRAYAQEELDKLEEWLRKIAETLNRYLYTTLEKQYDLPVIVHGGDQAIAVVSTRMGVQ